MRAYYTLRIPILELELEKLPDRGFCQWGSDFNNANIQRMIHSAGKTLLNHTPVHRVG